MPVTVAGKGLKRTVRLVLLAMVLSFFFLSAALQAADGQVPAVNGISLNLGYTYDPSDNIWFSQVSIFRIYDYDSIWPHKAPENLRFKVEGSLGGARMDNSDFRVMALSDRGWKSSGKTLCRGWNRWHLYRFQGGGSGLPV